MTTEAALMADDRDARARIGSDLTSGLFVEAGAGTGKTHELVSRIVSLLASGAVEAEGLVAITFTEAAAAELRDRVRRGLELSAEGEQLTEAERRRCARALQHLDSAAITTLHSFARRLLVTFSEEAGVPSDFEVLDEVQADLLFGSRWSSFLTELLVGEESEVVARALALGGRLGDLRAMARGLCDNWDRLVDLEVRGGGLGPVDLHGLQAAIEAAVSEAGRLDGGRLADRVSAELAPFAERLARVAAAEGAGSGRVLSMVVHDMPDVKVGGATPAAAKELRSSLDQVALERRRLVEGLAHEVLAALLAPLVRFALEAAESRRLDGQLEFHDLLVRAVLLLRGRADVRQATSERFGALLVDEMQDTDPLQAEMAGLLGVESRCFVGDPKQSIYRFRRADLGVYESERESFGRGVVTLSRNHRSTPDLLAWVNSVFEHLIQPEPGAQPPFAALVANRTPPGDLAGPAVIALGGAHEEGRVAELRQLEAAELGLMARELVGSDRLVVDPDGSARPLGFDDIAVLLPTRAALGAVEQGFERAGVPYRIESRSLLFSTDEVHDVLVVLEALDDPADEVAVVAALRGLGFACSDADLLAWRLAGGSWSDPEGPPDGLAPDHPVAVAMGELRAMGEEAEGQPVNMVVDLVLRRCRFVELAVTAPRPRDRWRRYRLLLDEARTFVEGGGESLGDFARWVRQQADAGAMRLEVAAPEEDDRAVRILTVHGAKGLEFPVVMLTGLNAVPSFDAPALLWSASGPELRLGRVGNGVRSGGYADALAEERRHDELEGTRLLYVAATRARDLLVVGVHHKKGSKCAAQRLVDLDEELGLPWQRRLLLGLHGTGAEVVHGVRQA